MGWNPLRARRERQLADMDAFRTARKLLDEDLTVFGDQLAELGAEDGTSAFDSPTLADYQKARDAYEQARSLRAAAATAEDVGAIDPVLIDGRFHLACVLARRDGVDLPTRRESCFFNPQHGPAVTDIAWTPLGGAEQRIAVCRLDADRVGAGKEPDVRLVRVGDRLVPWYEAGSSILEVVRHAHEDRSNASLRQQVAATRSDTLGKHPPQIRR